MTPEEEEEAKALKVTLYVNNAIALYKAGASHNKVIENCNSALALDPKNVKALFRRALCYNAEKEWKKAEKDLMAALEIDPENSQAKRELAIAQKGIAHDKAREKKLAQNMLAALGKQ